MFNTKLYKFFIDNIMFVSATSFDKQVDLDPIKFLKVHLNFPNLPKIFLISLICIFLFSVLTVSGEREINISMPDSVRRSLAEPRDLPTPDTIPRVALPVPGFISSDEEEELIISGNLRIRNLRIVMHDYYI